MSQIGPLVCPLLIGRDDLLELADRRIAEAAGGRGHMLLLAGEAGIGKTRLVRAVIKKAEAAGFRVATGDLAPQDRQVPLASILDVGRTMREDGRFGSLGEELLEARGGKGGDTLGSRRILVREIAEQITEAVDRPTLLVFEDLQWADEMSLEVIGEVARLVRDRPALLLGAYRVDELPPDSNHREWRSRLLSQRLAEEARLAPLTYEQTALVTSLIMGTGLPAPREVVKAVYERTDGVPLYIEELLGALGEDARDDGRAIRNAQVPETIEDAILARLSRLSEDARAVARAGAVIGRCFVPEVLAGVMDRQVADVGPALDELAANAFLYTFGWVDEGYYDFRHQLIRDALYRTVPATELRQLHARAGEFGARLEGAVGDPRVGALRARRPACRGVPQRPRGRASGQRALEPRRGVRAVRPGSRERPRRAPGGASLRRCTTPTARPRSTIDNVPIGDSAAQLTGASTSRRACRSRPQRR